MAEELKDSGYGPKYHTGKPCITKECSEPAGTAWTPMWCTKCDIKRKERISRNMQKILDELPSRGGG